MRTDMTPAPASAVTSGMGAYSARKRELLGGLTGTVLELGAGYGANFGYLRAGVDWLGLQPSARRRRGLVRAAAARGRDASVIDAPAERIPLGSASVDAAFGTVVLCSVSDQRRVLAEVVRVLRPSGVFVFFEHVAAPAGTWIRQLQKSWVPVSRLFDGGCDPGRDTLRAIERAGFSRVDARWHASPAAFGLSIPYIGGIAHV